MAWSKKSFLGQAVIASFVFQVLFKTSDERRVKDFIFSFLILIKGMRRRNQDCADCFG